MLLLLPHLRAKPHTLKVPSYNLLKRTLSSSSTSSTSNYFWSSTQTPQNLHPLNTTKSQTTDVVVIGLGGSGLSAISHLQASGASVIGLDAGEIASGAAGQNGGLLLGGAAEFHHDAVEMFGRERAVKLYNLTLDEIQRMKQSTPESINLCGSIRLATANGEYEDCLKQYDQMKRDGLPVDLYEGDLGRGLFFPKDGTLNPLEKSRSICEQIRARNDDVRLYTNTPILASGITGNRVTTATGAVISCSKVLVAVDGNLDKLLPELKEVYGLRNVRLQMLAVRPANEGVKNIGLKCGVYSRWGYDYHQELPDGSIALGGGRDVDIDNEWTDSTTTTTKIQSYLDSVLSNITSKQKQEYLVTHRWSSTVSYNTTTMPLFTEHSTSHGVFIIGGYCGTGNVIGSLAGREIAKVVAGEEALEENELWKIVHGVKSEVEGYVDDAKENMSVV